MWVETQSRFAKPTREAPSDMICPHGVETGIDKSPPIGPIQPIAGSVNGAEPPLFLSYKIHPQVNDSQTPESQHMGTYTTHDASQSPIHRQHQRLPPSLIPPAAEA